MPLVSKPTHIRAARRPTGPTRFGSRRGQCDVQRPLLPANFLLGFCGEPSFSPPLLEKLDGYLPANGRVVSRDRGRCRIVIGVVYLPYERGGALVDE